MQVRELILVQVAPCKSILALALEDEALLSILLQTLQPVVNEAAAPAAKKARLDGLGLPIATYRYHR